MTQAEWIDAAAALLERVQAAAFACAPPVFAQRIGQLLAARPRVEGDAAHEPYEWLDELLNKKRPADDGR